MENCFAIQLLVVVAREMYLKTQAVIEKCLNIEDDILNVFDFQQRLLFVHCGSHRCNNSELSL